MSPAAAEATATASMEATAASAATVEAATSPATAVEATTAPTTTVTATTVLRKCSGRTNQRHGRDCCEEYLETSGPKHVCDLQPTTSQEARAARSPKPFYIS